MLALLQHECQLAHVIERAARIVLAPVVTSASCLPRLSAASVDASLGAQRWGGGYERLSRWGDEHPGGKPTVTAGEYLSGREC